MGHPGSARRSRRTCGSSLLLLPPIATKGTPVTTPENPTAPTFAAPAAYVSAFLEADYVLGHQAAVALFLAESLGRPLLVEGPAGVGKTDLARVLAQVGKREMIRLQCYEGLDESRALYEWEYTKQLLYTQILRDKIGEVLQDAADLDTAVRRLSEKGTAFFSEAFLLPRPILRALQTENPAVLLIDEIDRADEEFEAFLLEVLADFQVTIPEIGTMRARHRPTVVLTSNGTRQLSDALRRRCLFLYLDFPDRETERLVLARRVPGLDAALAARVVKYVERVRAMDLRKTPGISETIDWATTLVLLHAKSLSHDTLRATLCALLKERTDQERAMREALP